ncbi:GNAT family N-acetyltransferase [Shimia sp.]|uniref:GNAT family N-acetyltransferase n=1 Tax=Shimia sp. TaxID=1954381 RepID=UPI0032985AB7
MSDTEIEIRPLQATDEPQWRDLWQAYLKFYNTSVPEQVYQSTLQRLLGDDPQDFSCLVAVKNGRLVGFTHFLFHRHAWKIENTCYLQDLYADSDVRGTGVGRKLIEAVYAAADQANAPAVYWLTQDFNTAARQLYDRVGKQTPFIRYNRP